MTVWPVVQSHYVGAAKVTAISNGFLPIGFLDRVGTADRWKAHL
ncbi:hypothetical protein [Tateyamaria sp. SN3-11]